MFKNTTNENNGDINVLLKRRASEGILILDQSVLFLHIKMITRIWHKTFKKYENIKIFKEEKLKWQIILLSSVALPQPPGKLCHFFLSTFNILGLLPSPAVLLLLNFCFEYVSSSFPFRYLKNVY